MGDSYNCQCRHRAVAENKGVRTMSKKLDYALNADCMEIMREYPDKYFDLAAVDPPYGSGGGGVCRRYPLRWTL